MGDLDGWLGQLHHVDGRGQDRDWHPDKMMVVC